MVPLRRRIIIGLWKLFDILTMAFSLAISSFSFSQSETQLMYFNSSNFFDIKISISDFLFFVFFVIIWHFIFSLFSLYESKRLSKIRTEIFDILKATTFCTIALFFLADIFEIRLINGKFLVIFWTVVNVIYIMIRIIFRLILKKIRIFGRNLRNIVIIGINHRSVQFSKKIASEPELGYRIVGFVDTQWGYTKELQNNGIRLVSNLEDFPSFLRKNIIDEVLISLPMKSFYEYNEKIASICKEQGIIVRLLNDFFNLKTYNVDKIPAEMEMVTSFYSGPLNENHLMIKYISDFIVSFLLIIIFSPVFLLAALIIKITTKGPVFFVQERLGVNKRIFRLYKFRTMVRNAENLQNNLELLNEMDGPVFKIKKDPRITPIGKILRKTSLDELPQLFNVLKGDMSLVGPRPLPIRDYEGFNKDWHRRRFSVRPGITCLWQVSGRNEISFDQWMMLDMQYIDNWSLWMDLKILFKTVPAVLKGAGAS